MKKWITLLLAAVLCLSLVACDKKLSAEEQGLVNSVVGVWSQSGGRTLEVMSDGTIILNGETSYKPDKWEGDSYSIDASMDKMSFCFQPAEKFVGVWGGPTDGADWYLKGDASALFAPYAGTWTRATGDTIIFSEDGTIDWNGTVYTPDYNWIDGSNLLSFDLSENVDIRFTNYQSRLEIMISENHYTDQSKNYQKGSVAELMAPFVGEWHCSGEGDITIQSDGTLLYQGQEYTPNYNFSKLSNAYIASIDSISMQLEFLTDIWDNPELWVNYGSQEAFVYRLSDKDGSDAETNPEVSGDDHSAPAEEPSEPETTEVQITLDNWQEYFEIKQDIDVYKNSFGEVESVRLAYIFFPKGKDDDSYWDSDTTYDVAFEYRVNAGPRLTGYYEYDTETNAISLVEEGKTSYELDESSNTGCFRSWTIENNEIFWVSHSGDGEWNEDNTVIRYTDAVWTDLAAVEITRIEGTITFKNGQ